MKYSKINALRKLSAALWDEENFIISLDHEHYTSYIKGKLQQLFIFIACLILPLIMVYSLLGSQS